MSWHFVLCLNEKHLHSKKKILLIRLKIVSPNRVTSPMYSNPLEMQNNRGPKAECSLGPHCSRSTWPCVSPMPLLANIECPHSAAVALFS